MQILNSNQNENGRLRPTFLPLVTKVSKKLDITKNNKRKKSSTTLSKRQNRKKYPLYDDHHGKDGRQINMDAVVGAIALMPFRDLLNTSLYLLDNHMFSSPENFRDIHLLTEMKGGKDILLNELMKEPPEVIWNFYQMAGRVKLERKKSMPTEEEEEVDLVRRERRKGSNQRRDSTLHPLPNDDRSLFYYDDNEGNNGDIQIYVQSDSGYSHLCDREVDEHILLDEEDRSHLANMRRLLCRVDRSDM